MQNDLRNGDAGSQAEVGQDRQSAFGRRHDASGVKLVDDLTRQHFSSLDGGLVQVTDITSHTLGVVLWDDRHLQEYVFPMIRKMTPIPAVVKNSFGTANA